MSDGVKISRGNPRSSSISEGRSSSLSTEKKKKYIEGFYRSSIDILDPSRESLIVDPGIFLECGAVGDNININTSPPAPVNLEAIYDDTNHESQLTWEVIDGSSYEYFNIYRSKESGPSYNQIASGVTNTNYIDTLPEIFNVDQYYYVVETINRVGNKSGYSNEARVRAKILHLYYQEGDLNEITRQTVLGDKQIVLSGFPGENGAYAIAADPCKIIALGDDYFPSFSIYDYTSGDNVFTEGGLDNWAHSIAIDREQEIIYRIDVINVKDNIVSFDYQGNRLNTHTSWSSSENKRSLTADFDSGILFYEQQSDTNGEIYKLPLPNGPQELIFHHPSGDRTHVGANSVNKRIYYGGDSTILSRDYNGDNRKDTGILCSQYSPVKCGPDGSIWFHRSDGTYYATSDLESINKISDSQLMSRRGGDAFDITLERIGECEGTDEGVFEYCPPDIGPTEHIYTSEDALGRLNWPDVDDGNHIQENTDQFSNGEVAIDPIAGYTFVAHQDGIYRFDQSFGSQIQIKSSVDIGAYGVTVDPLKSKLYVSYESKTGIFEMNYDGSNETKITETPNVGLALDLAPDAGCGEYIFAADPLASKIYRWTLSGNNQTTIVNESSISSDLANVVQLHLGNESLFYQLNKSSNDEFTKTIVRADFEGFSRFRIVSISSSSYLAHERTWTILEDEGRLAVLTSIQDDGSEGGGGGGDLITTSFGDEDEETIWEEPNGNGGSEDTESSYTTNVESWDLNGNDRVIEGEIPNFFGGRRAESSTPMTPAS